MSRQKRKIKNWIIKKLGGYTPQEYGTISRPVITGNTAVETRGVEHLWIQTIVNQPPFWEDTIIPAEAIQKELVDALLEYLRCRDDFELYKKDVAQWDRYQRECIEKCQRCEYRRKAMEANHDE